MSSEFAIVDLFKSHFLARKLGNKSQISTLKDQMLDCYANNRNSIPNTNPSCWRSNTRYNNIDWLLRGVEELTNEAIKYYAEIDSNFNQALKGRDLSFDYWTNINKPGSRLALHRHSRDTFAAVYYVQAANTGNLKFINPANVLNDCNNISPFINDILVPPQDGELLLWPAWLPHEVELNQSGKDRMNIVFSIKIQ